MGTRPALLLRPGELTRQGASALRDACLVTVTLDGAVKGCASYDAPSDIFQFDIKMPKNLALGPHAVGVRVSGPGGVVNDETVVIVVKK